MRFRIVADSSCNVLSLGDPDYTTVPLKIVAAKEYVDNAELDLAAMVADLQQHILIVRLVVVLEHGNGSAPGLLGYCHSAGCRF